MNVTTSTTETTTPPRYRLSSHVHFALATSELPYQVEEVERKVTFDQLDKELDEYSAEVRRLLAVKAREKQPPAMSSEKLEAILAAEEQALEDDLTIFRNNDDVEFRFKSAGQC